MQVEICTPSRASAMAAKKGGAQRIELCRALECGGLTPTDEDIDYCVRKLGLRTHVLVRPRSGNFCYTPDEIAEIEHSILRCKELGATAVVIGFLTPDGRVDEELTHRMTRLAAPLEVTFHRAFDEAQQKPLEALQSIINCGCQRLLTSGQSPTAIEGAAVIKRLVDYTTTHAPLFKILAGSGVTPDIVRQLIEETGVTEVHGSCKDANGETDADTVLRMISTAGV